MKLGWFRYFLGCNIVSTNFDLVTIAKHIINMFQSRLTKIDSIQNYLNIVGTEIRTHGETLETSAFFFFIFSLYNNKILHNQHKLTDLRK